MNNSSVKIGMVGVGMVGSQLTRYFSEVCGFKRKENLFLCDTDARKGFLDDVNQANVIFISVPTPMAGDGSCDISIIESVIKSIAPGKTVVIKSTVPPGTTDHFQSKYPELKILFNPEFLTENRAWEDMLKPDRQIIGFTEKSRDAAKALMPFLPRAPFEVIVKAAEAELIKYASNVYLARRVNWANALAKVADKLGLDYENIRKGLAADARIGGSHLDVNYGGYRGFGGYCLPKDTAAFKAFAKDIGLEEVHDLLSADWKFNEDLLKSQGLTVEEVSKHIRDI